MRALTPAKRRRVAYHEAGHAVACIFNELPFKYVTIRPTDEAFGHVRTYRMRLTDAHVLPPISPRVRDRLEREAVSRLAGIEAERLVSSRYHHGGAGLLRFGRAGPGVLAPGSDYQQAYDLAHRVADALTRPGQKYSAYVGALAQELVARRRVEIAAVADALLERETLSEADVRTIVLQAVTPPPRE